MNLKWKNAIDWLLPVFLILFILEVIAFPFAVGLTYAGRSEDPNHTLTYRTNELTWSDVQGIDENGVAELSIFDAEGNHQVLEVFAEAIQSEPDKAKDTWN